MGVDEVREQRFRVCGEGLELTITLDPKWLSCPFDRAVVLPFVKRYNSRRREEQRELSVDALVGASVDGSALSLRELGSPTSALVPPTTSRVDLTFGEPPPTEIKIRVNADDVSVKMTLDKKWLARTLTDAVIKPFLTVYNKRVRTLRTPADLVELHVDGVKLNALRAAMMLKPLDALGRTCSEVRLFFSHQAVRAASDMPAPTFRRLINWSKADYQQLTELVWDHKGFNRADGAEMAKAIMGASPLRKLKYIYLYGNHLGNEGLAGLAPALKHEHVPELKELHLHGNRITNVGVVALAEKCNPSPKLAMLSLHENAIGDEGVAALANAITAKTFQVQTLTLYANPAITAAGREQICSACAGADFVVPTPERGPVPFIPLDHTPQRWVERE